MIWFAYKCLLLCCVLISFDTFTIWEKDIYEKLYDFIKNLLKYIDTFEKLQKAYGEDYEFYTGL